jgi:beta-galactosidase/beta-glucuronidase
MSASRASLSLDGEWSFVRDPRREHRAATLPPGEPIQVPGCWETQIDQPYGIVTGWYRREIDLPEGWAGGRLVLRFGAVMYACEVFLNGQHVGGHEGGYTPFEIEAGGHLQADRANDLAVRVTNPVNIIHDYPVFPEADLAPFDRALGALGDGEIPSLAEIPHGKQTWYSSQSGIWQSVSIEKRPAVCIGPLVVRPDVNMGRAVVEWSLDSLDKSLIREGTVVRFEVRDPSDGLAAEVKVAAGGTGRIETTIPLDDIQLWDVGLPRLYRIVAQLVAGDGSVLDEATRATTRRSAS